MGVTLRWIIDDGPLDHLAEVVKPPDVAAAWPRGVLFVADATRRSAALNGGSRARDRHALLDCAGATISTCRVDVGTPAFATLYGHLRSGTSDDKHLAEHEAIAWALHHATDAIFVAGDKGAVFQALAELGRGSAAHPTELWIWLRDEGHITDAQFEELCECTRKNDSGTRRPLRTLP